MTTEIDEDAFLRFIEYARSALWSEADDIHDFDKEGGGGGERETPSHSSSPPWSWIVSRVLKVCKEYPSGVTKGILLSDLSQAWCEQNRHVSSRKRVKSGLISTTKRHRRKKLPSTVTIDSIHEKNFLNTNSTLEVVILDAFVLPGTNIYMLNLGDIWSSFTIDVYLHRRYYDLMNPEYGILKKGREIFLTGCCLRTSTEGHGHLRLLPTEHLMILLDEDEDEDAMFIGAQFCSDSFSSISLDAFNAGSSYAFYASYDTRIFKKINRTSLESNAFTFWESDSLRIEYIGPLEVHATSGSIQTKKITLIDGDGVKINFLLWGEQVLLANLLSAGSMLAVDRPFITNPSENNFEAQGQFCLEYGSATKLYLVPFVQQEEQVLLNSTQIRYQGSGLSSSVSRSQSLKISQVSIPLDYEGSIDLKTYPFRSYVTDLHNKMTGICLYGIVAHISREANLTDSVYYMTIKDITGAIMVKLHFLKSWSLGRVGVGCAIYMSGLMCSFTNKKQLEASWFEKDLDASFVNLSCLPAFPNSLCLHNLSCLSHLLTSINTTHICSVQIDDVELRQVNSRPIHTICGRFVEERSGIFSCDFCSSMCSCKVIRSFDLNLILADKTAKISASCNGSTAAEILQIFPDEFYMLPEILEHLLTRIPTDGIWKDEQAMYLLTLQNECFTVVLVNSKPQMDENASHNKLEPMWEIVHAQKC